MHFKYSNIKTAYLITSIVIIFILITIVIPCLFLYLLPKAGIAYYIMQNQNYFILTIPISIYLLINGIFLYNIRIDPYVVQITSYRTISSILGAKNYIDISHKMLKDYSFFDRPFSINKTLMIKIGDNNKIIIKRFNMTLISEKEIENISKVLDRIIVKNN